MPRGLPDYYNPDTLVSQRLANVEEVVTAVQKLANIDNRGRTLFFDSFGEGLSSWLTSQEGDGVAAVSSTTRALIPPASAFLDAGTSGGGGVSNMIKQFHLGASALLGWETSLLYTNTAPDYRMFTYYNLEGNNFFARLDIQPLTGIVRIWVPDEFITVANIGYNGRVNGPWLLVKLVADFANGKYVRALVGHLEIDLSSYSLDSSAVAAPDLSAFWLSVAAVRAVTNYGYVGHVIATVDEP